MNDRVERSVQTFIKNLAGAEVTEIQQFVAEITSNQKFHRAVEDKRRVPDRRRYSSWSISSTLGEVLYAVCRKAQPAAIVETGVAGGVSSSYILQSLEDNRSGDLYSIDLPFGKHRVAGLSPII
jgi:predicted O-methyltransferase YrrM